MQRDIESEINSIKSNLSSLSSDISFLSGQKDLLKKQIKISEQNLEKAEYQKERYAKAIELLNFVQKATKEKIKEGFEKIVTYALQYIYSEDYKFELEFGRRGNLSEIDLKVITPKCKKPGDPLVTSGGGVLDILSLALRIALLELSQPKVEGFIVLDEPFKHLSVEYLERARTFIEAINKKIGRQIILITHKQELVDSAQNSIEIK